MLLKVIDLVVHSGFGKVLPINWPGIMVALDWNDGNVFSSNLVFDHLCRLDSVVEHLFFCVIIGVMWRIVTGPE